MLDENLLLHFFQEQIDLQELQDALEEEFYRDENDADSYHYTFQDMDSVHTIEPTDLVVFCEAILAEEMRAEGLTYIAECLLHAEKITWDDEIIDDVCHYWLEPEGEYPPDNDDHQELFIRWLKGEEHVPEPPVSEGNEAELFDTEEEHIEV